MSLTAPEQPSAEGQDPQVTPDPTAAAQPPAPAAPTPAAPQPGPWANDLNAIFTDESTRGQVDQFLREKVQPYTTKLEQQASQSQDASRLWNDLNENPVDTYVAITEEMFGADVAQQLLGQIQQQLTEQQQQAPQTQQGNPLDSLGLDPDQLRAVVDYVQNQQTSDYYEQQIQAIQQDPQYADVDTNLLHPFVAAADGDFAQGVELYRQSAAQFQSKFAPAPPAEEQTPPPNVLGSDTATVGTPPTIPQKQSLGEAIEEFARENRSNPAPPVGTA